MFDVQECEIILKLGTLEDGGFTIGTGDARGTEGHDNVISESSKYGLRRFVKEGHGNGE